MPFKMELKKRKIVGLVLNCFFLLSCFSITQSAKAQDDSTTYEIYQFGFEFNKGIYKSLDEFRNNAPSITSAISVKSSNLSVWEDSSQSMVLVDPDKVWGYAQAGNVYISHEGHFWRIINIGQLCQFTAIIIKNFQTIDSFGFPIMHQTKSIEQVFMDVQNGEILELNAKNLSPYIEAEPQLDKRFKNLRRIKPYDLILALKAYNELNPLYIPIYE